MPAQPNQSLADGVALLQVLCSGEGSLGSRELARQMGWEPTRANRLLGTLRALGLAEQDAERRYRPGPGVHVLAAQCLRGSGLLQAALPVIRDLHAQGHGMALGVLWHAQVCYLVHAAAGRPIEEGLHPARFYPAENSSIGMALEAAAPGPHRTATAELARIRARGHAIQRNPGLNSGSVAVIIPGARPDSPPVAALAAMVDYRSVTPASIATVLHQAANAIAARLHRA